MAKCLGGEERIERLCERLPVHASTAIPDGDEHVWRAVRVVPLPCKWVAVNVCRFNGDHAAVRHGIPRVHRKIEERVLELDRVGINPTRVRCEGGLDDDPFSEACDGAYPPCDEPAGSGRSSSAATPAGVKRRGAAASVRLRGGRPPSLPLSLE